MHRGQDRRISLAALDPSALLSDPERAAEQRLGRGRSETHDQLRRYGPHLGVQPGTAGRDFSSRRLLVKATLPSRLPFEVLHGICDVRIPAIDPGRLKAAVEQVSGGPNEGLPGQIFLIAGLFSDHQEGRALSAFAEDGLSSLKVEIAAAAIHSGFVQGSQTEFRRKKIRCGSRWRLRTGHIALGCVDSRTREPRHHF